ncbi:MAG TPA: DUF1232 domain-containing protein [Chloroflexota bacterium]|nr:DUF1232 domain-containing protein [Chloroflexota bacterium]
MGMFLRLRTLFALRSSLRLAWRLFWDRRVPASTKLMVPLAVLYGFFPLDLLPDFLPALGQIDDLTVAVAAALLFLRLCPKELVQEHKDLMAGRVKSGKEAPRPRGDVLEGEYKVMD